MIRTLHVRNLRSLTDARGTLSDRLTLVLGDNGAGKSTLANSILYSLTGWCRWTDRKGAGFGELIRHGAPRASIELEADFGSLLRELGDKAVIELGGRVGKDAETLLSASLPDRELLAAMLDSGYFVGLPTKQQQDLLFKLAGGEANADWFSARLTDAERDALRDDLATRLSGSQLADALYKTAYAKRTEANRTVKELDGAGEAITLPDKAEARENSLASELARAKRDLAERQQQIGASDEQAKAYNSAEQRCEASRKALVAAEAAVASHGEKPTCLDDATISRMEDLLRERLAEHDTAREAVITLQTEERTLSTQVAAFLDLAGGSCVLGSVQCPLNEHQRAAAVTQARARAHAITEKDLPEAEERRAALAKHCDEVEADIKESRNQQRLTAAWDAEHTRLGDAVAEARKTNSADLEVYQKTPSPDRGTLERNLQSSTQRVQQLETELADLQRALGADSARKRQLEQLGQARGRAKMLDDLVKKLSPDGLPAQAMAETVGAVTEAINQVLAAFTDMQFGIGDELTVSRGSVSTAVRLLCDSEQLRVGAAISVAFAKLTGFGFVVVDAADRLDNKNRGPLLAMLLQSGVQALVLATPLNGKRPAADGLKCYDLADGVLVECGAA